MQRGAKLIVWTRAGDLARLAPGALQFRPDTDVAMLNAMMNVIVTRAWSTTKFIAGARFRLRRTGANVAGARPSDGADLRHPADTIREVARRYATSGAR